MKQRELKFRAWHPELKYFIYFNPLELDTNKVSINTYVLSADAKENVVFHCFKSKDVVIQQFTGVKDKNNKEIYEGDIVKSDPDHIAVFLSGPSEYTNGVITWLREGFGVCQVYIGGSDLNEFVMCNCCPCGLEIIGNIMENPELELKVRNEE